MQTNNTLRSLTLCSLLLAALGINSQAQTTAIWTGPATGGEWNTAANWSTGLAPADPTTNAFIGLNTNVNYNVPMAAGSIGSLTNLGLVTINAGGFVVSGSGNSSAVWSSGSGLRLLINNGGALSVTNGGLTATNQGAIQVNAGGSLTASGIVFVGAGSGNGSDKGGFMTNNGGVIKVGGLRVSPGDGNANSRAVILSGTNDLGDVIIQRSNLSSSGAPGVEGFLIYGGLVRMNSLDVGGNNGDSYLTMLMTDGVVTNAGSFSIRQKTAGRGSRFLQTGGLFVATNTGGIHFRGQPANNSIVIYSVTGGTNIVDGFIAADPTDVAGTLNFTNAGKIYVGSLGFSNNTMTAINVALNGGGTFGAWADWTAMMSMGLGGAFTFNAAALDGTPHNITLLGNLGGSGSATLTKTGNGILTLNGLNTYLGDTAIGAGSLVLGPSATIAGSGHIILGSNTVFDVSALAGAFTHSAGKTLNGWGAITGDVTVASAAIIDPGSNNIAGTLSFSNSITMTGGAKTHFDLSTNPSGPNNDVLIVQGDLNTTGVSNVVDISGGGAAGTINPLFKYYGNFNGTLGNFAITGPNGYLTNVTTVTPKLIAFVPVTTIRPPTSTVWVGNPTVNDWDVLNRTNWLNSGVLDFFVTSDNVSFTEAGGVNTNVNLPVSVSPGSVTVNSTTEYWFSGPGGIAGSATLIKTNSGRLNIQTTNQFTGGVTITGGTVSVPSVADDGLDSPLGNTGNLVVDGGTLEYVGDTAAWTRSLLLGTNGTDQLAIANPATVLAISGTLSGGGALTKTGNGSLTLSGANSFSGGVNLNVGTLTINSSAGAGSGQINLNGGSLAIGAFKPGNTINVAVSGTISGGNAGGATGINKVIGSAPLTISVTTGVFDLINDLSGYSGVLTLVNGGGGTVRLNSAVPGSQAATWDLGAGPMDLNVRSGSTSNNIGALQGQPGTTLSGRGGSSNSGSTTYYIGWNGLNTEFDGVIQNGFGASGTVPATTSPTSINKVGAGTLSLGNANTHTGTTTISTGSLALVGSGSISSSATVNIVSGATLDVSALGTPTFFVGGSQSLQGRGTVLGSVDSTGGLRIAPGGGIGGSVGTLTATNSISLGGTTWMKLNRASTPNSDRLVSSLSTITYGGTLVITNIGAPLQVGDTFTLFSGAGLAGGTFSTVVLPNYYNWDISNLGVNGSVSVTAILPPPAISSVDFSTLSSGSITLNGVGAPDGPVVVFTSTDIGLPFANWTPVSTNSFDGGGNLNVPITVDPNLPQSFYMLQAY